MINIYCAGIEVAKQKIKTQNSNEMISVGNESIVLMELHGAITNMLQQYQISLFFILSFSLFIFIFIYFLYFVFVCRLSLIFFLFLQVLFF